MGKEAQKSVCLSDEAQKEFDECVAALTAMRYPDGRPPKETTFAKIEAFGHEVGRMLGRAVDQQLTADHASHFLGSSICPTCQSCCDQKPDKTDRQLQTADGQVPISEPTCHCSVCDRDFFPQRIPLGIDGRSYSPSVLEKIMYCAGTLPAYQLASQALSKVGEISITGRHIGNLAERVGQELCESRDARTDEYFNRMLPRISTEPNSPIRLATVSVDGGRIQTRTEASDNGVQDPHWRETKNALFMRMSGVDFREDPQPDLPSCFKAPGYMKKLLSGLAEEGESEPDSNSKSDLESWRPERLFRTCLSSLADSKEFGRMMEAEADSCGFLSVCGSKPATANKE